MYRAKLYLFSALAICFVSTACQSIEKIIDSRKKPQKEIVTKVYEKNGLSFSHPNNWKVTEDSFLDDGRRIINVEDSDNTLFIITLLKPGHTIDLKEYSEDFIKGMASDIPLGKIAEVKDDEANRTINNQNYLGIRKRFSITLLGENVPHTIDFFLVTQQENDAVIVISAPDEDLKVAEKEIQIIADSITFYFFMNLDSDDKQN
ncbi:hypothetical protein BH20ACI1_BH20ACI1_20630 [soil metagenome]